MRRLALFCTLGMAALAADIKTIVPQNAAKPVGPYSPGLLAGDYLYVSGQGAIDASGKRAEGIEAQIRQGLNNVKAIVDAAGLTLDQVVHTQLYLADIANYAVVDKVWKEYFKSSPPRVTLIVARMPTDTPVEITVVAYKGSKANRFYIPEVSSFKELTSILKREKLSGDHIASITAYHTSKVSAAAIEKEIAKLWKNNRPAVSVVEVPAVVSKSGLTITGVAAREQSSLKRNGACSSISDTAFCSLALATGEGVEAQTAATFAKLQLDNVVATNVYLDSIDEFAKMNAKYAEAFKGKTLPTRTTVQPLKPGTAKEKFRFAYVAIQ